VVLLGQLLLHELIDSDDFLGKGVILLETLRHENNLSNGVEVWYHHSHRSEEGLEVIWKLRTTSITWIHGDEKTGVSLHLDGSIHEGSDLLILSKSFEDGEHLLCDDGEHLKLNSVKLIEATPGSRESKTSEGLTNGNVVHGVRAVLDNNEECKILSKILNCLSLTSTGGSLRSTTSAHVKGISESHICTIGKSCDHKTTVVALVLITVVKHAVGLINLDQERLILVVELTESQLLEPLEVLW
jgi:hypothetical protein